MELYFIKDIEFVINKYIYCKFDAVIKQLNKIDTVKWGSFCFVCIGIRNIKINSLFTATKNPIYDGYCEVCDSRLVDLRDIKSRKILKRYNARKFLLTS